MSDGATATRVPRRIGASTRRKHSIPQRVFLLAIVFYSFLLFPPELSINLGGLALPSYRLALLALSFPAFMLFVKRPKGSLSIIDSAVLIACFWIMFSFIFIYGFAGGMIRGGGIVVDIGIAYFIARASIATLDDVRYFLVLVAPGFMFAGFFLLIESISGTLILRPAFASVFGSAQYSVTDGGSVTGLVNEKRLGLLRAYGPFGHPILSGVFMISFLPVYFLSGLRSWPYIGGVTAACMGIFGLSSAVFLGMGLTVAAIIIDKVRPYIPKLSWWTISGFAVFVLVALQTASQNGIFAIVSRLTLTPHTAHYRRIIWEYGLRNVENNPWIGIGYQSWERLSWMHDSVDAHFLLLAMRHGVIVPIILVLGLFFGVIRLGVLSARLSPVDRNLVIGINISLVTLFVVGQTVAFFGSMNIAFMALLGILASINNWAEWTTFRAHHVSNLQFQSNRVSERIPS